ncbi:MAG: beta-lactamase family protein [Planctomycetes bacterium]|nr:beta-lactamase family protein [Planctomycetota bacterium]
MPIDVSRRTATQTILAGAGALAAGLLTAPFAGAESNVSHQVTGIPNPDMAPFDTLMIEFLTKHNLPGAALAVTRDSRLVYARGFGDADTQTKRPVQPDSLFRLASISKPITAVAVMQQVEQSGFHLDDRVFDILPAEDWLPEKHDPRLRTITVRQLLQHTAGWDREKSFDPIGRVQDVARVVNKPLPANPADVIRYTLTLPLDFDPGTRYAYYNVDFLLLGRLIEHVTKQPYEAYVKQHVLSPIGITRMHLGRAWKDDLDQDEVRYYDSEHRENVAINGSRLGDKVPQVYGAENIEAYEAHGGWVGSAIDLVRFASAFDDPGKSKVLKPASITAMWSRPEGAAGHEADGKPKDSYYGCGWMVRSVGEGVINTFHSGLIAGTSTLLVRRHDRLNWAVLFNTDANARGERPSKLIDPLVHQAADAVKKWPDNEVTL